MERMPIRSPFPASALRPDGAPMALSDTLKRGEVGASLKGQFYQYQRHGKWVTAKWPKKRGKPKSAAQSQAQKDFAAVCRAIKLTAAEVQMYARANAAGTPMLPRDAMMAALYGNGPTIRTYSGKVIKPMANALLASTVLDAIGWAKGDMLVRNDDRWEVLSPGLPGYVLQTNGPNELPTWVQPSGGGGSAGRLWFTGTIVNYVRQAPTFALAIRPAIDFKLNRVMVAAQFARTYTLRAELWERNGLLFGARLGQSLTVAQALAVHEVVTLTFQTPPTMERNKDYFVVIVGYDNVLGDKFQATYGAGDNTQRPWAGASQAYYSATPPAPGNAVISDGGGAYMWAIEWE